MEKHMKRFRKGFEIFWSSVTIIFLGYWAIQGGIWIAHNPWVLIYPLILLLLVGICYAWGFMYYKMYGNKND